MNYASPPRSVAKKHRIAWLGGFSSEYWKPDPHQQLFFSPKTQNKNESNLNLSNKKKTIKSKISYPDLKNGKKKNYQCQFRQFRWLIYGCSDGPNLARERTIAGLGYFSIASLGYFSLSLSP